MVNYQSTCSIVLKEKEINEWDKIFVVFSRDFGKIEITARAIRKITSKLRSGIELFSLSELIFIQAGNKRILIDVAKKERFDNVFNDVRLFRLMCWISQLIDYFVKGQEKDEKTFDFLLDFLKKINSTKKVRNYFLISQYFFWNFLAFLGYCLELEKCLICGRKINSNRIWFSLRNGGVFCNDCTKPEGVREVPISIVKILKLILNRRWDYLICLEINFEDQRLLKEFCQEAFLVFGKP